MRNWLLLLGGLIAWAAHFFLLYGIGEFARDGPPQRIAIAIATLLCAGAVLWLMNRLRHLGGQEGFDRLRRSVALGGAGIGLLGIVWQTLPILA